MSSSLRAMVLSSLLLAAGAGAGADSPRSATVPFTLDHNRMFVEVDFVRTDGSVRKARAWVDTGGTSLTLAEPLARDLGLDVSGLGGETRAAELASPAPSMRLGGLPLRTEGVKAQVVAGASVLPGVAAEATLPASLFRDDHVVFDYPARRLTVARPGVLEPRGIGIGCRVNAETGLFMIAATVEGDTVQLGVDNGSAGTWVSSALTAEWKDRHPDWPQATGAAGSANFFGFPFESEGVLMRLPELGIGGTAACATSECWGSTRACSTGTRRSRPGPVVGIPRRERAERLSPRGRLPEPDDVLGDAGQRRIPATSTSSG